QKAASSLTLQQCLLSSVAWASDADYDVRLVQDCCYDPDRDAHEALLRSGFGGRVQVV
ncbi:TPA: isochorismatase family protein, partial [Klebsiella pneumoniae]|nr:isochorismatase family protein [Klebsiella pneumoniae]